MGRKTNHGISSNPKYREVKRELCHSVYIQIKLLSNSAAEVKEIQFGFIEQSRKKKYNIVTLTMTVLSNFISIIYVVM